MVAGETAKIGIIRRCRDAEPSVTVRYNDVRRVLREYLCNPARTRRHLDAIRVTFEQRAEDPALGGWAKEDARLSVDVLDAFSRMENQISGSRFVAAPAKQAPLEMSGVIVSVNLDVLAVRERGTQAEIGGVLFRMTKADEETDAAAAKRRDMGAYAATLALMQIEKNFTGERQMHHQLCASFDVQCLDIHRAPRSYVSKAKAMEDACRFIAALWDDA
jgi:hypothetical protein